MKVILLQNTECHDGVRAQICCSFWFDRCLNEVLGTGKEIDVEYCYNEALNVVCY